jgi:hypothetical protein
MTSLERHHQAHDDDSDGDDDDSSLEGSIDSPVPDLGPEFEECLDTLDTTLGEMDRRCRRFLKTAEKLAHQMDLMLAAHTRQSPLACKRFYLAFHILLDDVMDDQNRLVNKRDEFEECMLEVRKWQRQKQSQQNVRRKRRRVSEPSATEHLPDAIQSQGIRRAGEAHNESADSLDAVRVRRQETHEPLENRWQGRDSSQPPSSYTNQDVSIHHAFTTDPALPRPHDFPGQPLSHNHSFNSRVSESHRAQPACRALASSSPNSLNQPPRSHERSSDIRILPKTGVEGNTTRSDPSETRPLVQPEDIRWTAFSFHLFCQLRPCAFSVVDKNRIRKFLPPGFPGLACRHCFAGRFFPSSIRTMSDASKTLYVLHNHMIRCRRCPPEIRETLSAHRKTHDEQRANMKYGSQRAFFARIWDRLHYQDPNVTAERNLKAKNKPEDPALSQPQVGAVDAATVTPMQQRHGDMMNKRQKISYISKKIRQKH